MWQPVLMICGYFINVLGITMLFPAAVDIYYSHAKWSIFINSSIVSLFIGLSLFLSNRGKIKEISIQQAYLLTVLSWTSVAVLGALPFIFYGSSLTDALFEGFAGVSTTGVSIYSDIESLPPALLLWRALLNGLGGVGIVIFATALLPFLGVGGMQIFQRENSDVNEKIMPKISYMAKRIILTYLLLMAICMVCLRCAGMTWFDALCHALSTVSTGGSSTKNASIAAFSSVRIEWIIILFMYLSALPLAFYYSLLAARNFHSLRFAQVSAFTKILLFYILILWLWLIIHDFYTPLDALRYAAFNVVSVTSSTGFYDTNYLMWGGFPVTLILIFSLTGGCSGSTTGSIKIFRWQVVFSQLKRSLITTTEPNRMVPLKVGGTNVNSNVAHSVFVFLATYMICVAVLTACVSLTGVDFTTAFGSVVACMTNAGSGLNEELGPNGTYAFLTGGAKLVLSFAMILGRLEVMTVLVLFSKSFWR